jgi:hypothetical protein
VLQAEWTWAREAENGAPLAYAHEDAEGLVRMVGLLEGELSEARRAREAVEVKFHSLSSVSANGVRRLVVSKKEH